MERGGTDITQSFRVRYTAQINYTKEKALSLNCMVLHSFKHSTIKQRLKNIYTYIYLCHQNTQKSKPSIANFISAGFDYVVIMLHTHDQQNIQFTIPGSKVTHLWHFGRRSAHRFLLPDLLLDEDRGYVEGAQQRVGLEPQRVTIGRQQLQGVQRRIKVVAATQLNQQVHQRLTERGRKRGGGRK